MSNKNRKVLKNENGPPCPRCRRLTQVREHADLTEKLLHQPFYYSRWYCCVNDRCRTTLIMPPEFKVERSQNQVLWTEFEVLPI